MRQFTRVWLCTLLCATVAACNRVEPGGTPTGSGSATLQPVAQFNIGEHVAEPSGVVYDPRRNSLLVVSDSHPDVAELRFDGTLIRKIATTSLDMEGIGLSVTGDTIYVAEERNRLIALYSATGARLSSFSADVATLENNALEGVTVRENGNVFVLNEKMPGMLLEYTPGGSEIRRVSLSIAADYSDIMYDKSDRCLWIISDESQKIMRTDLNGTLLAQWNIPFGKGEGIAVVRDTMYIVNDADAKLYLFLTPR